jgi:hypothetical protein
MYVKRATQKRSHCSKPHHLKALTNVAAYFSLQGLAQLMGPQLLDHVTGLQPVLQQRVGDAVALAGVKK